MTREYREAQPKSIDGDLSVGACTDEEGKGWYLTLDIPRYAHLGAYWLTPSEARKMAKHLIQLSYKTKVKTHGRQK